MRARTLGLCLWLSVLACDDDPVAPTSPAAAFTVTPPIAGWDPDLSSTSAVRVLWSGSDLDGRVQEYRIGWDDPLVLEPVATVESLFVLTPGAPARPVPHPPGPRLSDPQAVVQALALAYRRRDSDSFASLLAEDPARNAEYLFLLSEPTELGETQWGYGEEARIHQRMFHPESPPPGDPPVPPELWLQEVAITLTPLENFTERVDLYSENGGFDGKLDPMIWRVKDARYSTYVFFDFTGTDYKVDGEANFVVIEDLTKDIGDAGKFLIYIWEDIYGPFLRQAGITGVEQTTWGGVKSLFR